MGLDADAGADVVHFLVCLALDRDIADGGAEKGGEAFADGVDMRAEFWLMIIMKIRILNTASAGA